MNELWQPQLKLKTVFIQCQAIALRSHFVHNPNDGCALNPKETDTLKMTLRNIQFMIFQQIPRVLY